MHGQPDEIKTTLSPYGKEAVCEVRPQLIVQDHFLRDSQADPRVLATGNL
jgi:hypothetical protein